MEDSQNDQTPYQRELKAELAKLNPADFSHATRLLTEETRRVESGDKYKCVALVELHNSRPSSNAVKCKIPVQEFPKINFVGKLLGPKGNTLKTLQQETGCKLSILGRGSMRDKNKEEELRKEGGKYAHLNEDLHVMVECFAQTLDAYARISHALGEIQKFMDPANYEMETGGPGGPGGPMRDDQHQQQPFYNGEEQMMGGHGGQRMGGPRGQDSRLGGQGMGGHGGQGMDGHRGQGMDGHRGQGMDGPPGRGPPPSSRGGLLSTPSMGGRGGMAPRGGSSAPRGAPSQRGAPAPRGAPSSRGQPMGRGGPPPSRGGGLPSRGTPPPRGAPGGRGGGRGLPSLAQQSRPAPVSRPQPLAQEYDDYGAGGYDQEPEYSQPSRFDDGYGRADPYAESSSYSAPSAGGGGGDTQFFDYGHGTQSYRDEYAEPPPSRAVGYERNAMKSAPPAPRGRGNMRQHPYDSGRGMPQHGRQGGY